MNTLYENRYHTATLSKGISSGPIYDMVATKLNELPRDMNILEFGSGAGNLLHRIKEIGFHGKIVASDIQPRPIDVPRSIEWVVADLNDRLNIPDNSFDLIVSTEVVEHLENPRAVFREFSRLLRPTGKLILTTPNQESVRSYAALLMGGHFAGFLGASYPAHITALLRKDFERICSESGFRKPEFFYSNKGGIPKFPSISWQNISFNLLRGRLFSDNFMVVTEKPADPVE